VHDIKSYGGGCGGITPLFQSLGLDSSKWSKLHPVHFKTGKSQKAPIGWEAELTRSRARCCDRGKSTSIIHLPRIKLRQLERQANKNTVQSHLLEVSTTKFNRQKIMRKSVLFVNRIAIHEFLPGILKTSFPNLTRTLAILKGFP